MMVHEFKCEDCGDDVIQFGGPSSAPVCSTCQWIRTLPNEHDRQRARQFLDRNLNGERNA